MFTIKSSRTENRKLISFRTTTNSEEDGYVCVEVSVLGLICLKLLTLRLQIRRSEYFKSFLPPPPLTFSSGVCVMCSIQ